MQFREQNGAGLHRKAVMPREDPTQGPLRERLLRASVAAHLSLLAPDRIAGIEVVEDDPASLSRIGDLAFLPAAGHGPPLLSIGLVAHEDLVRTRPLIVCTRALGAELKALTGRCAEAPTRDIRWVEGVVGIYTRAIFLDRFDLADSLGFAPWTSFRLVDGFPVKIPEPSSPPAPELRLLLVDHGAADDTAAACIPETLARRLGAGFEVIDLQRDAPHATAPRDLPEADLHVHVNYARTKPVFGFSPEDSILSGFYTIVQPTRDGARQFAGQRLTAIVAKRSYAQTLSPQDDLATAICGMARRITALGNSARAGNPELENFRRANAAELEQALGAFEAEAIA